MYPMLLSSRPLNQSPVRVFCTVRGLCQRLSSSVSSGIKHTWPPGTLWGAFLSTEIQTSFFSGYWKFQYLAHYLNNVQVSYLLSKTFWNDRSIHLLTILCAYSLLSSKVALSNGLPSLDSDSGPLIRLLGHTAISHPSLEKNLPLATVRENILGNFSYQSIEANATDLLCPRAEVTSWR